jgi:hypothetical protein
MSGESSCGEIPAIHTVMEPSAESARTVKLRTEINEILF